MKKIVRAAAVTIVAAAAAAATSVFAAPAHAHPLDLVVCTPPSSNHATYHPALTREPQTVTLSVSAHFHPCVSLTEPHLTSATSSGTATVHDRTCTTLLGSSTSTFDLHWNTGQTSTITNEATSVIVGGVYTVTSTGEVTAGQFEGSTYAANYTGPAVDILACNLGLGTVSSVHTVGTMTITSILPS